MKAKSKVLDNSILAILIIIAVAFLAPIFIVLMNAFKGQFFISETPFKLPDVKTFVGFDNFQKGIEKTKFANATGWSLFITVFSVLAIVLFTAMTAWYITRVKSKFTSMLYYLFVFSMIVPFQMVMFTLTKVANVCNLDNP
ncbi:MAG TPA: carbohydrate ABC transporter permease, partial [Lachnospiraceae bacterium]|nr:carbohydrate ABC transporter permease [Lachnospiraceae bacterium]